MSSPTGSDLEAQRSVPPRQEKDVGGSVTHETSNPVGQPQTENDQVSSHQVVTSNANLKQRGLPGRGSGPESPIIGDFDNSANALWRLYETKTRSPDEAHIQTLKDDMERVLTFTGLFAVVLTAFIIEGKKGLKVDPQDEMAYYLRQNIAMLDQISRQISFIAPQFPINSTPPAPFPDFKPSASDIRVNIYWFIALVFSLSAAFLATLVQQSVRDYMDAFQRYSDPLTGARLRQYLYEGLKRWCIPIVGIITGILHVSLFLFFVGLCDFVFNIKKKIGFTTAIPIAVTGLLYFAATFARVISPQLPYRTSFSGFIWYVLQKLKIRRFKIRGPDGASKHVRSKMTQTQMQLAMAETKHREMRDERAIRRLVSNMTDDAEIESLVMAIPGSFSNEWGLKVWKNILSSKPRSENTSRNELRPPTASDSHPDTTASTPAPPPLGTHSDTTTSDVQAGDIMQGLSVRVGHLLDTCLNRRLFVNDTPWRMRTRACVETTALLVVHTNAKLDQFGDMDHIIGLLGDIGDDQTIRDSSLVETDHLFIMRWTCLSLIAIRPVLESNKLLQQNAKEVLQRLEGRDYTSQRRDATRLDNIIQTFNRALRRLGQLSIQPNWREDQMEERVQMLLRTSDALIEWLEQIDIEDAMLESDESSISTIQDSIDRITHGVITRQLPGIKSDVSDTASADFSDFVELFRDPRTLLFTFPLRNLKRIRVFAQTLRAIHEKQTSVHEFRGMFKKLQEFKFPDMSDDLFHRQMWRFQDLQDGGGLGFTVELFFLALKQLLSNSSSNESHSAFYRGTFHAITSNWSTFKDSRGTQELLLNMVVPERGIIFAFDYPSYIVTAFLEFLGNILHGMTGQHIDDGKERLANATRDASNPRHREISTEALGFIAGPTSSS